MPSVWSEQVDLESIAALIGTPFYLYDAATLRERIAAIRGIAPGPWLRARFAMKACSARRVLETMREHGMWIDAVSGNEVLRARAAGFAMGSDPPAVMFTADAFRDNALEVIREHHILPNVGSPAMLRQLADTGHCGDIGIRINPGFGHGHARECDTGGPSSKHGIWHEDLAPVRAEAERLGMRIALLHAHIGTGPEIAEFDTNLVRLGEFFAARIGEYEHATAVNLGGGIPHAYRPDGGGVDLDRCARTLADIQGALSRRARRPVRVEIEPGRYFVAAAAVLATRVTDVKQTRSNEKGPGQLFAIVDAGFCDLVRPAMYGSYHHITVHGRGAGSVPTAVAGPLCESGDVFTRDAAELIDPRPMPEIRPGDLLVIHDAGAYGSVMSSNYNSIGRAPQVWRDQDGLHLISRRETAADLMRAECFSKL